MNKAVLTLTTIPSRLNAEHETGIKLCIDSICNQDTDDYQIHFNIPNTNRKTGEVYEIPGWLENHPSPHLKIFRTEDYGSITKIVPTLKRVDDPETIIIICDDDLVYHHSMVSEQINNQSKFEGCSVGYDGSVLRKPLFNDQRDHFAVSIRMDAEVRLLQGYKTVSFKRKYFEEDFFTDFIDESWNDDVVIAAYMGHRNIRRVVTYHESDPVLNTIEEWIRQGGVTTFPVLNHTSHEGLEGCNLWRSESVEDDKGGFLRPLIDREVVTDLPYPVFSTLPEVSPPEILLSEENKGSLKELKIYDVKTPKIRLGNPWDGGYVLPVSIAAQSEALVSYGVGTDIAFEKDYCSIFDRKSYCFDHTVEEPFIPDEYKDYISFKNEGLSIKKEELTDHFFAHYEQLGATKKVLLKIDAEGIELDFFLNTDIEKLASITTGMIVEFHCVHLEEWRNKMFEGLSKVNKKFLICHNHANNYGKTFTYVDENTHEYELPEFFEITFINKELVRDFSLDMSDYPQPIDIPNDTNKPEISLDFFKRINDL